MVLPRFSPLPLELVREPFDDPGWIFELKYDGFRALLYQQAGTVRLISRRGYVYKFCESLCADLARDVRHAMPF